MEDYLEVESCFPTCLHPFPVKNHLQILINTLCPSSARSLLIMLSSTRLREPLWDPTSYVFPFLMLGFSDLFFWMMEPTQLLPGLSRVCFSACLNMGETVNRFVKLSSARSPVLLPQRHGIHRQRKDESF